MKKKTKEKLQCAYTLIALAIAWTLAALMSAGYWQWPLWGGFLFAPFVLIAVAAIGSCILFCVGYPILVWHNARQKKREEKRYAERIKRGGINKFAR